MTAHYLTTTHQTIFHNKQEIGYDTKYVDALSLNEFL